MSDLNHIARPYAKAVFDLANEAQDYSIWSEQLALLAAIVNNTALQEVLQNPAVAKEQQAELVLAVASDSRAGDKGGLNDAGENLVKLLAQNSRLNALAQINEQFLALRDAAEQVIEAQLVTATAIDAQQTANFATALSKRLGKQIKLETLVDEDIIGGAIVRAGDWVVDGSVKAQLQSLVGAISA